jgi:tetratricopeptide (TPR) repeat protein
MGGDDVYPYDLGSYRRVTSTRSAEAARWFDRGLAWSYGFHHEEAIRCFERAIAHDDGFALAHWGIAYAVGPNYNKAWDHFDPEDLARSVRRAHDALARALELAQDGTTTPPVERALIEALGARFAAPEPAPDEDFDAWTRAYAERMGGVYAEYGDDLDVAALYADALVNITAWQLWDVRTGQPAPGARTLEARRVLETAMARPGGMEHPGLLHLYIHLIEMSGHPEDALPAAEALRHLVPDAGHLVHMPSHIDVLVGEYARVVADNERAIAADDRYFAHAEAPGFYSLYRAHNHHFRIYGAMFAGRREVALEAADALAATLPEPLLRGGDGPPMADWLEGFVGMKLHVLVRFGMWDEILALPLPADPELYAATTAMTWYAKGVALAVLGRVGEADDARAHFAAALERVPETRYVFNNTCRDILAVAAAMLDGELAYRKGDLDRAWDELRRAIELDDNLPYDEPWGWMQPTRHAYGALLLEQGHVEEAAAVYEADLGLDPTHPRPQQHPNNVWSLRGYHQCLTRLGRTEPAAAHPEQLDHALGNADVPIHASCFCAREVA